eukprot:SAG31_NODE_24400_length_482_cov_0.939948_1_plen_103_part_10
MPLLITPALFTKLMKWKTRDGGNIPSIELTNGVNEFETACGVLPGMTWVPDACIHMDVAVPTILPRGTTLPFTFHMSACLPAACADHKDDHYIELSSMLNANG